MFENAEIQPEELPAVDAVTWQDMDAKFLRRQLTESGIGFFFTVIGISSLHTILNVAFADANMDIRLGWLWLIPLFLGPLLFAWPVASVRRKGYAIRERDIIYKSGIFWQTVTAIPFNRIQHVEKSSTPLDRRFQLASLQIYTAGGSGGDLKIHGLPAKTAEKLRAICARKNWCQR